MAAVDGNALLILMPRTLNGNGEGKRAWNQRRNAQRKAKKSAALTDDVALCTSPLLYLSFKEYKPIALLQQNPWDVFDRYC